MPGLAATLIIASTVGMLSPTAHLQLSAVSTDSSGHVVVGAIASNDSAESVEFCGRWGFEVVFVPNHEGEQKISAYMALEEEKRLKAEAVGENYFSRCGPQFTPTIFDIGGLSTSENWIKLAPGEAYSDTIDFVVEKVWYEQWPGAIEVRYRMDLCEGASSESGGISANGLGGGVVTTILVP